MNETPLIPYGTYKLNWTPTAEGNYYRRVYRNKRKGYLPLLDYLIIGEDTKVELKEENRFEVLFKSEGVWIRLLVVVDNKELTVVTVFKGRLFPLLLSKKQQRTLDSIATKLPFKDLF